jgi:NAD(P)-dependent dehydrogenase (short-subunit alcohol dehydrogenase family)
MKQTVDYQDKAVVVTGAASGIGLEIARAFAHGGARLALADVNGEGLRDACGQLESLGCVTHSYVVDVSSADQMRDFCDSVYKEMGRVDILCNNAGVGVSGGFEDIGLEDWQWIVAINLWGVICGCHYFYPRMIAQGGGGHIVNIASAAGLFPLPGSIPYSCTKHAVVGLSETLRAEASLHGIGVSAVCPGFVASGIYGSARQCTPRTGMSHEEAACRMEEGLRKHGRTPEKVAAAVLDAVDKNKGVVMRFPEAYIGDLLYRLSRGAFGFLASRVVAMGERGMGKK